MEIYPDILEAVSVALTKGQGQFTEEEIAQAYAQVANDMVAGTAAELVMQRAALLTVKDGEVKYGTPEGTTLEDLAALRPGSSSS